MHLQRLRLIFELDDSQQCALDELLIVGECRHTIACPFQTGKQVIVALPHFLCLETRFLIRIPAIVQGHFCLFQFGQILFQATTGQRLT